MSDAWKASLSCLPDLLRCEVEYNLSLSREDMYCLMAVFIHALVRA